MWKTDYDLVFEDCGMAERLKGDMHCRDFVTWVALMHDEDASSMVVVDWMPRRPYAGKGMPLVVERREALSHACAQHRSQGHKAEHMCHEGVVQLRRSNR